MGSGSVVHSPWQVSSLYWHFDALTHYMLLLCDHPPHPEQDDEDHLITDDLGHPGSLLLHRRDPLLQARVHHLRVHLSNHHNDDDCDDDDDRNDDDYDRNGIHPK